MKKLITLSVAFSMVAGFVNAQVVNDSVIMGAGYANQVWYSMANDEQGNSPKASWDIAFEMNDVYSSVLVNAVIGVDCWVYPNGDTSDWGNVDTAGIGSWPKLYNSTKSWSAGALNVNADPGNQNDIGWGQYNPATHVITGDSIYILKLADGSYKKLWIESLKSSVYYFKYANLDGTSSQSKTMAKADYSGKNFGYYSLQNNAAANREPAADDWDITFTQYKVIFYIPQAFAQTVTGVLGNKNTSLIKAYPVNDPATFTSYSNQSFASEIDIIGYDWKVFDMNQGKYFMEDSTVYFIKDGNDDVWKLLFTGFVSAEGKTIFSKENLTSSNGIFGPENKNFISVYPNPANSGYLQVVYDLPANTRNAVISLSDMSGKTLRTETIGNAGFGSHTMDIAGINNGIYLVSVQTGNGTSTQKVVVNK